MNYKEYLGIILLYDNGKKTTMRIRKFWLDLAILALVIFPCLCGLLIFGCVKLWEQERLASQNLAELKETNDNMKKKLERLETLSALMDETTTPSRDIVIQAMAPSKKEADVSFVDEEEENVNIQQMVQQTHGPGHVDFPALSTDYISVNNVQIKATNARSLRVSMDLQNSSNSNVAAEGDTKVWLMRSDGQRTELDISPTGVGKYRIMRFKRAVLNALIPKTESDLQPNDQLIIEVSRKDTEQPVFRSIYAIER